ncbi:hypothetical protein PFICI_03179 [Pestalotiopsis fici W106-1]|uniref:Tyrosinase copper-binding domain-containing protein n=1 Tax=Pestalotiopsis fici (strain W106-1 / CGMCC3.15140) TaxID=1229662 RepID=W3XGL4_PESFW|nr:uncharacterized protein PFICI_03179 [Pestalotiopsis fici W106-1]ETS85154.1 hypothetical protein PFICI_03179 [Pestalotiopsis fici W106-1]
MLSFALKTAAIIAALANASPLSKRQTPACTTISQRVPWTNLTSEEKTSYINADLCLINAPSKTGFEGAVSRWDDLQWPHGSFYACMTIEISITNSRSYVHSVGAFLPFHRYYMTVHERAIRQECGYTGRIPYWDEVNEVSDLAGSDLWKDEYFGGNGVGTSRCVQDGPFASLVLRWQLNGQVGDHCLTRNFNQNSFNAAAQSNIDRCNAIDSFTEARSCWEGSPHSAGHGGVGGILWWEWQKLDPENRMYDMAGTNLPARLGNVNHAIVDYFNDGGNQTTLNHTLYMDGLAELAPNITINDIMDLNGEVICAEYINV